MKLNGQEIFETDEEFVFALTEPYWSAWKKYKWINKECGFGISVALVRLAYNEKKKIIATYNGISYTISPVTINNFYKASRPKPNFKARGKVRLVVIPQSKFNAVKKFNKKEYEKKELKRSFINQKKLL